MKDSVSSGQTLSSETATFSHTPLPWFAVTPCQGECCWHLMPDTPEVRERWADALAHDKWWDFVNVPEMSEADANLIVRCVNSHAGLVDALSLIANISEGSTTATSLPHIAKIARAALAETQQSDADAGAESSKPEIEGALLRRPA